MQPMHCYRGPVALHQIKFNSPTEIGRIKIQVQDGSQNINAKSLSSIITLLYECITSTIHVLKSHQLSVSNHLF